MRHRQVVSLLVLLAVAAVSVGAGGVAASAQPAAEDTATRSGETNQANRGKGKRPSCRRFCAQAGGFGACDDPDPEVCPPEDVDIPAQKIDGTRDLVISVRATCKLAEDCIGAILVNSFKGEFEYGRADFEVPAGQTAKVKVGISKQSLQYLKKHGKDKSVFVTVPLDKEIDSVSVSADGITILPPD
jgi:hypothetical protein